MLRLNDRLKLIAMKRQFQSILLALPLLFSALLVLAPAQAAAAPGGTNITTSPVSLNLPIKPGTSTTNTLQLLNNGTVPIPITVSVQTFTAEGSSGLAAIKAFAPNDPAPSWVHFSETQFTAQPGVWKSIKMTVDLPSSAQLGYYYAVLFKPTVTTEVGSKTNVLGASNAILVLVDSKSANEQRRLTLSSFDATQKRYNFLPATFNVTVHNVGNIYEPPRGVIYITRDNEFRKVISTLDINTTLGNVLPNSSRTLSVKWNSGFPLYKPKIVNGNQVTDTTGQPVQHLTWNFSQIHQFRFGKYYAHLDLVYNNGVQDIPIESSLSFWVIPWTLLLVVGVILLILIVGLGFIGWLLWKANRKLFSRGGSSSHRRYRA
jgi:hypothetical protein